MRIPPPSLLFWIIASWLSCGCIGDNIVDESPFVLYRCTMVDALSGELTGVTFTCAPRDDRFDALLACSQARPDRVVFTEPTEQECEP